MNNLLNIPQSKWVNSNINKAVAGFPGQILTYVKKTDAKSVLRLEKYLSIILWRWYFLVNDFLKTSPNLYLTWRHELEDWPKESQFLVTAKTHFVNQNIDIILDVDVVIFNQQPLLADLLKISSIQNSKINKKAHESDMFFSSDSMYKKLVHDLNLEFSNDSLENKVELAKKIVVYLLNKWYETDKIINQSWTKKEWQDLWSWVFLVIQQEEELVSEEFFDKVVNHTRKIIPDFGLTNKEMNQSKDGLELPRSKTASQFLFWLNCTQFFTLPLSWYLHLVSPVFLEQSNFDRDVKDTLANFSKDPIFLFNPFSALSITNFGRKVLTKDIWR